MARVSKHVGSGLRQMIEGTPPGTSFTREGLLAWLEQAGDVPEPEELSTVQAARLLGRSPKWWRLKCAAGAIEGAYQDAGERWRLPTIAARSHISRRRSRQKKLSILRGPRRKAPPARSARNGSREVGAPSGEEGAP